MYRLYRWKNTTTTHLHTIYLKSLVFPERGPPSNYNCMKRNQEPDSCLSIQEMSFESRHFGWSFKEGLTVIDLSQFVQVLFVGIIFAAIKYWSEMSHVSTPLPVGGKGYMPTLPDYLGVSRIWHQSPGLLYRSPNFPDKIELWAFLCFNLEYIPFSAKIQIFFDS